MWASPCAYQKQIKQFTTSSYVSKQQLEFQVCLHTKGGPDFIILFLVSECVHFIPILQLNWFLSHTHTQRQSCVEYQVKTKEWNFNKSLMLLWQNSYTSIPLLFSSTSITSSVPRKFNHKNTKLPVKYSVLNHGIKINW